MRGPNLISVAGLTFIALLVSSDAIAAKGYVSHRISGCDYFLVETAQGYAILEWYGGNDPDKDDLIVGDFERYGLKTVYNATDDAEIRVWVEDFWLSRDDALEKLVDKCD